MGKQVTLTFTLILITLVTAIFLLLPGCKPKNAPSKSLVNKNIPSPHKILINQEKNNPEATPQNQAKQEQKESNSLAPIGSIPPVQASESTFTQVYKPSNPPKYVYLTFDDGPNTNFTGRILDILAQQRVKATFAVVGLNAEKNSDLLKRIVKEGHVIINHTYTHDYKKIYASPEELLADMENTNQVLEKILGQYENFFRPPGGLGYLNKLFREKLKENGYQLVGWNVTGGDSNPEGVTPEQVYYKVTNGLTKVEKLKLAPIILLHDGAQLSTIDVPSDSVVGKYVQNRESVVSALPRIIELLKQKGYTFAVVDESTPPSW
ncbi:MAG: hypothetical protein STSR0004_20800 [Peptococcaceae bacterium]